jgi:AraC-like DNA-binding protein
MEFQPQPASSLHHPLLPQLQHSPTPADCARNLGQVLPLRQLDSLTTPKEWWHRDGELPLNHLPIAASVGAPYRLECDGNPLHWLLMVHDGRASITQNGQTHALETGDGIIIPGEPWTLHAQHSSTTTIGFDPLLLLTAARTMAPAQWTPPSPVHTPLRGVLPLPTRDDAICAALVDAIGLELPAIHHISQLGHGFVEGFLLQEQLYRIIAALVFSDLRNGHSPTDARHTSRDRRLDRLLDYITLHLADPLPLKVLEHESNYSRRSLHYAFQDRFGCSPMQWIRQQRMQLALQRLQHPQPEDTVATIANHCGYRSLSRFRIDFERTHGSKPSAVLRGAGDGNGSNNTSSVAP